MASGGVSTFGDSSLAGLADNQQFQELTELIVKGKVVAFVGSGLSLRTGQYPTWMDLVERLCNLVGIALSPDARRLLSTSVDHVIELSQIAREMAAEDYKQFLYDQIGKDEPRPDSLHRLLVHIPFLGFVTTNFDTLLQKASEEAGHHRSCKTIPELDYHELSNGRIFHVHGRIMHGKLPVPSELVLTREDFGRHYASTTLHFLHQLLQFQNVVFLGCTLREPELARIFEETRALRTQVVQQGDSGNRLRVLLPAIYQYERSPGQAVRDLSAEAEANQDYFDRGIDVMRYENSDGSHSAVETIINYWYRQTLGHPTSLTDEGVRG